MGVGKWALLLVAGLAASAQAEQNVEYKCFVELNGKTPFVAHFVLSKTKAKSLAFSLPYTKLHMAGSPMVSKVYECVEASQSFSSNAARKQEKEQVF